MTNFKQTTQKRNINEKNLANIIQKINRNIQSQIKQQEEKKKIIKM